MLFPLILILREGKKSDFFYNNLRIRALVIYFCFVFINLINDYKIVYSRNNNLCLGVCMMVFMRIDTFFKNYCWYGGGYLRVFYEY